MNENLKLCPFCGNDSPHNHNISGAVWCDDCHSVSNDHERWNTRPLEDELLKRAEAAEARVKELEAVIRGMFPLWINAMGYCEHGKKDQLMAMRNYYNGRGNPMTSDDIHVMFSLIPEKDGN